MPYDLSKYKFQPGDKVRLVNGGSSMTIGYEERITAHWDIEKCNRGTILEVTNFGKRGNSPPWVIVTPDEAGGFGQFTLQVKDIEHDGPKPKR